MAGLFVQRGGQWFNFELVVPPETSRVIDSMRRPGLRGDVERFMHGVLREVGKNAKRLARRALDSPGEAALMGIRPAHVISAMTRDNPGRRQNTLALRDTQENKGGMRQGITARVDRAAMSVTLGVVGPHADLARFHEGGFHIRLTEQLAYRFRVKSQLSVMEADDRHKRGDLGGAKSHGRAANAWADLEAWANRRLNEVIEVPPRQFLRPAVERTVEALETTAAGAFMQGIMNVWVRPTESGGALADPGKVSLLLKRGSGGGGDDASV